MQFLKTNYGPEMVLPISVCVSSFEMGCFSSSLEPRSSLAKRRETKCSGDFFNPSFTLNQPFCGHKQENDGPKLCSTVAGIAHRWHFLNDSLTLVDVSLSAGAPLPIVI